MNKDYNQLEKEIMESNEPLYVEGIYYKITWNSNMTMREKIHYKGLASKRMEELRGVKKR